MSWFDWFLIGFWIALAVNRTRLIGKPIKPLTPGSAAFLLLITAGLIAGLLVTRL